MYITITGVPIDDNRHFVLFRYFLYLSNELSYFFARDDYLYYFRGRESFYGIVELLSGIKQSSLCSVATGYHDLNGPVLLANFFNVGKVLVDFVFRFPLHY